MRTTGCYLLACGLLVVVLAMGNPFLGGRLAGTGGTQPPAPSDPAAGARSIGQMVGGARDQATPIGEPVRERPVREMPRPAPRAMQVRAFQSPIWLRPGAAEEGMARASSAWWHPSVALSFELPGEGSVDWGGAPAGAVQAIPAQRVDRTAASGSK